MRIECAMDELAYAAKIDPLELRLINYSDKDQIEDRPYSSKELRECYRQGAERFGWSKRNPQPRSMRDGNELVGWGMATGVWEAMQMKASARAVLTANGSVEIASATADIGPGTYTMMTQLAAEMLGVPLDNVTVKLGDSALPDAPVEGGSFTASSVGSAIHAACRAVQEELLGLAREDRRARRSPARSSTMSCSPKARSGTRPTSSREVSIADAMRAGKADRIEKEASAEPNERQQILALTRTRRSSPRSRSTSSSASSGSRAWSARWPPAAFSIRRSRAARSSAPSSGASAWRCRRRPSTDHRFGRFMTHNLADYHVPVNADVHAIDVIFVEEKDDEINPLGVKGVGEIGIVGTAAAIANAVYHATGKRVRDLPITLDKLMRN